MRALLFLLGMIYLATPAIAASSQWLHVDGGALRFIARNAPSGGYETALEVKLEPGFKTYWKVPGSSGLPPILNLSADRFGSGIPGASVTINWPAPSVFSDGLGLIAGYKNHVVIPIAVKGANNLQELTLTGIIGVCGEICIPVQFSLSAELGTASASKRDEALAFTQAQESLISAPDVTLTATENGLVANLDQSTETAFWVSAQPGTAPIPASIEDGRAIFTAPNPKRADGLLVIDGTVHRATISATAD